MTRMPSIRNAILQLGGKPRIRNGTLQPGGKIFFFFIPVGPIISAVTPTLISSIFGTRKRNGRRKGKRRIRNKGM